MKDALLVKQCDKLIHFLCHHKKDYLLSQICKSFKKNGFMMSFIVLVRKRDSSFKITIKQSKRGSESSEYYWSEKKVISY